MITPIEVKRDDYGYWTHPEYVTACDVLAGNMPLIEDAGYHIVLTVHDEVICEAPDKLHR